MILRSFALSLLPLGSATALASQVVWEQGAIQAAVLTGTRDEIAEDAIILAKQDYASSMASFMREYSKNMMREALDSQPLMPILSTTFDLLISDPMTKGIHPQDKLAIKGMARAYNMPEKELQRAFIVPDATKKVVAIALPIMKKIPKKYNPNKFDSEQLGNFENLNISMSCSSFVAGDALTKTGERLVGRNWDYAGLGVADKHIGVYLVKPSVGAKFKTLVVAPKGLPNTVITAMNEAGLVLTIHSIHTTESSVKGDPILSANRLVIENASTIEEAIVLYEKQKFMSGWTIHLSDRHPKTGKSRSAIIELSKGGVSPKIFSESYSTLGNEFLTPAKRNLTLWVNPNIDFHNKDRQNRLTELVRSGNLDIEKSIAILKDSYSPYSKTQVEFSPSSIRVAEQLQTVLFAPDRGKVYVAQGPAPASQNDYYIFSFEQMEKGEAPEHYIPSETGVTPAFEKYVQAYQAYTQDFDHAKGAMLLSEAHALSKDCSFALMHGANQLRAKLWRPAQTTLETAAACPSYNPHQKAIANYLLGINLLRTQNTRSFINIFPLNPAFFTAKHYLETARALSKDKEFTDRVEATLKFNSVSENFVQDAAKIDIKFNDKVRW